VWDNTLKLLLGSKIVSSIDGYALEELCKCRARILENEKELHRTGILVEGSHGQIRANPLHNVLAEDRRLYKQLLAAFGMTPADRTRVQTVDAADAAKPVPNVDGKPILDVGKGVAEESPGKFSTM